MAWTSAMWLALASLSGAGSTRPSSWIGDNWNALKEKTLMQITLPGSHNAGNIKGALGNERLCMSDYRYPQYKSLAGKDAMVPEKFDSEFLPWNVNHDHSILQQLVAGVRWFHFKVCNFNDPAGASIDLDAVFHQHRGYTAQSVKAILEVMADFLEGHPHEVLSLGFNNLHQNASTHMGAAEIAGLSIAVKDYFSSRAIQLIDGIRLQSVTLRELVNSDQRVAVFFPGEASILADGVIPSENFLTENWDPAMISGNLTSAMDWLLRDLKRNASESQRYYVLQANPNDDERRMLQRIKNEGQPLSLKTWIWDFLRMLEGSVRGAVRATPLVKINAITSDFLEFSRPFEIAMALNGLPYSRSGEVITKDTNAACLNPAVISGRFADVDTKLQVKAAYVMQRHTDRWIYEHPFIDNYCWPQQTNSSTESSKLMFQECSFGVKRELSTVWETFAESSDPYSAPWNGTCQIMSGTPQATQQGHMHAKMWGEMLRQRYVEHGLVSQNCQAGDLHLHADAVHKNQITAQSTYDAICGRLPDIREFPKTAVLVESDAPAKGKPWYLRQGQCGGSRLAALSAEAEDAKGNSIWWTQQVDKVAKEASLATGKPAPASKNTADLLDNVIDCAVVHACTGLGDVPAELLGQSNLPSVQLDGLFMRMNRNETQNRVWAFDYLRKTSPAKYMEFASLYYGYFFAILKDQLLAAAEGVATAPKLTISVMSDGNISPLLAFYDLSGSVGDHRPPYLSALVHELLEDSAQRRYIRVIYNGQVQKVCLDKELCPFNEWSELVDKFVPDSAACPTLYDNYKFLAKEIRLV